VHPFTGFTPRVQQDIDGIIKNLKSMDPMDAMKEANLVIGRKGKYKNLSGDEAQRILKDTDDHIFQRDIQYDEFGDPIKPDPEDLASGGRVAMAGGKIIGTAAKKIGMAALGPTGAAGLWYGLGGVDPKSAGDRMGLAGEAAFAPELVKSTIGATKGMKNRGAQKVVQQLLNLGMPTRMALRVARVAQPLGLLALGGEGLYKMYKEGHFEKERMMPSLMDKGAYEAAQQEQFDVDQPMASGGIARVGHAAGKIVKGGKWFIKNFKSLIDEAANPGPWSRFSEMGSKDKQAAIADAKEMIKRLEAGDSVPEYLLEDIVANPKFKLKRTKATDPDLAEVENLTEGYNRLKLAREKKFRGPIEDFRTGNTINSSSALDDYNLFTPTTTDMYGKSWKGKKNWIKEERAKALKIQEEIGPAPSSRHPEYRSMVQIRKGLEDRLTALDITEELGGNIKMFDKLRMHNYPTYKNTLDKRDWLMPPGGLKRREAFVIDLGHHTLPPVKKAEGGIAGQLHLHDGGRARFGKGGPSNPGRRNFLKLAAGLAALPVVGKFFKWAKPLSKASGVITRGTDGIPSYAYDLIEVVKAKGTKEIMEGIYKRNPPSAKYNYKGVEVIEDGTGGVSVRKEQTKTGSWHDEATDDTIVDDYVDREVGFEIRPAHDEMMDEAGATYYRDLDGRAHYETKIPDEYNESTAYMQTNPDGSMDVSEVLETISDADHLELQKIADEGSFLTQKRKRDKITRIKEAEGGRVNLSKGGLANILGV